jgi:hypothetical protein
MLVPRPKFLDTKIKETQNVFDIVSQIKIAIKNSISQANKVHRIIRKNTQNDEQFLRQVWTLSKKIITYKREPFWKQTAKTFSRIWHDGYGDCKHFTIFIASILKNDSKFKDKVYLRIIEHNGKDFTHIYIVIKDNDKEIILDGTAKEPFREAKYNKKIDFKI